MIAILTILVSSSLTSALKGDGFLGFSLQRVTSNSSKLDKRDVTNDPVSAANQKVEYIASISLGNPGQPQKVTLDTGSSDLWVWGNGSGASTTYNPSLSSDSHYVNSGFQIGYMSGDSVSGDYYNDTFTWDDLKCNLQFGIASHFANGDTQEGILGLSFKDIEGSRDGTYSNLPYALKDQGFINTAAYSMYLDDYDAADGTILFGAIDTSKFNGKLTVLNTRSPGASQIPFKINGTEVSGTLDSGTSLTYIPESILNPLIQEQWSGQLTWDSSWNLYRLNAADRPQGTINFTFNDVEITLGPNELWIKLAHNAWYLGVGPTEQNGGALLLGDIFLRSAYVVYDLENSKIAIAPANYNGGSPNYEKIENGVIPNSE